MSTVASIQIQHREGQAMGLPLLSGGARWNDYSVSPKVSLLDRVQGLMDGYWQSYAQRRLEFLFHECLPLRDATILVAGLEDSRFVVQSVLLGASRVIGLDDNPALVRRARTYAIEEGLETRCEFYTGGLESLDFSRAGFDFVLGLGLLERTARPEEAIRLLGEVATYKLCAIFPRRWHATAVPRRFSAAYHRQPMNVYNRSEVHSLARIARVRRYRISNLGPDYCLVANI